jgi:hypothetical protein
LLPIEPAAHIEGGFGRGDFCTICARPVGIQHTGIEARFADRRANLDLYCHSYCYSVWDIERLRFSRSGRASVGSMP